jgi:hypothetical protein
MGRTTTGLIKSLEATTAIPARRFVKFGAADGTGVPAVDGAAYIRGVSPAIDTDVGERCSVQMTGNVAEIVYGGNVTRGDPLTADAQGRAGRWRECFHRRLCRGFGRLGGYRLYRRPPRPNSGLRETF